MKKCDGEFVEHGGGTRLPDDGTVDSGGRDGELVEEDGSPPLLLPVNTLPTSGITASRAVEQYGSASVHGSDPRRRCASCETRSADQVC